MANTIPIPAETRALIASDPFMKICIYESEGAPNKLCEGRIEWEHTSYYAGRRITTAWIR